MFCVQQVCFFESLFDKYLHTVHNSFKMTYNIENLIRDNQLSMHELNNLIMM